MKEKKIKNVLLRYSQKYNLWVNRKGTHVYREYKNSNYNRFLQIHQSLDGNKYLSLTTPGIVELDEVVADCYVPKPRGCNKYVLIHKDGDLGNCDASNLEWKSVAKFDPLSTKRKLNNGITVTCDGKFYDGKKELPIVKEVGDADTDRIVGIDPFVYYKRKKYGGNGRKNEHPDDLMAEAEFVNGDRSKFKNPKALHKDNDYLNFNEENLEWVEESSQEYQEYKNKKKTDIDELTKKLNPNKPFIGRTN